MTIKTIEQFRTEVTSEIESEKPLYAQTNNVRREFTDEEYSQAIEDRAQFKLDQQNTGYKEARQIAYKSVGDQLDQLWHAVDSGLFGDDAKTSDWYTDINTVKTDNPKPA